MALSALRITPLPYDNARLPKRYRNIMTAKTTSTILRSVLIDK
jgi:hypothetical protein